MSDRSGSDFEEQLLTEFANIGGSESPTDNFDFLGKLDTKAKSGRNSTRMNR